MKAEGQIAALGLAAILMAIAAVNALWLGYPIMAFALAVAAACLAAAAGVEIANHERTKTDTTQEVLDDDQP